MNLIDAGSIVFATRNSHKVRELRQMVSGLEVLSLTEVAPDAPDVDETGSSFAENAILKAVSAYLVTDGVVTVADDSGLCVDALDGAPGLLSARFAGDDEDNNNRLLSDLAGEPNRAARYHCALALICPEGWLHPDAPTLTLPLDLPVIPKGAMLALFSGEVHGVITSVRRGLDMTRCFSFQRSMPLSHRSMQTPNTG